MTTSAEVALGVISLIALATIVAFYYIRYKRVVFEKENNEWPKHPIKVEVDKSLVVENDALVKENQMLKEMVYSLNHLNSQQVSDIQDFEKTKVRYNIILDELDSTRRSLYKSQEESIRLKSICIGFREKGLDLKRKYIESETKLRSLPDPANAVSEAPHINRMSRQYSRRFNNYMRTHANLGSLNSYTDRVVGGSDILPYVLKYRLSQGKTIELTVLTGMDNVNVMGKIVVDSKEVYLTSSQCNLISKRLSDEVPPDRFLQYLRNSTLQILN